MALIYCPECKKQISDKAESCPHCGLPGKYYQSGEGQTITEATKKRTGRPESECKTLRNMLIAFERDYAQMFSRARYIPASEARAFYDNYGYYVGLLKDPAVKRYIANMSVYIGFDARQSGSFVARMEHFFERVDRFNEHFIAQRLLEDREYFDHLLKAVDPAVHLDEEQRRAVLTDDDYCLLVAGAGAGKTTTMAAKVKYLVDKTGIAPEDIIVISYTNKAINELKERINDRLNIPVKICTFHSFGYGILKKSNEIPPAVNYKAYGIIFNFLEKKVFNNRRLLRNLVRFLGYYFDFPENIFQFGSLNEYCAYKAGLEYETIKSRLGEYIQTVADRRTKKIRTITGEFLRSMQEVQIANFLYLHGLDYIYEKPYPYRMPDTTKIYTPDFFIKQGNNECYLEHFGITESYQSELYSRSQLEKYIKNILNKRKLHRQNGTRLIQTWCQYNDGRSLLEHLEEELLKNGFILKPREHKEVYKKLTDTGRDKYVYRLILFLIDFIERFKTAGFDEAGFAVLRSKTDNVRSRLFLDIAEEVYLHYQEALKQNNQIDFADMINDAEKLLREMSLSGYRPAYRYIVIDEFQDIARQRFNLTKTLADVTGARVVAVGDDWQSIFAFAGSDITLFQKFLELMGDGKEMQITRTYRNSQELIDIAGGFVQKNPSQIKKRLVSPKRLENPIMVECFNEKPHYFRNWTGKIEAVVGKIAAEFGPQSTILMIGRYNFDRDQIIRWGNFTALTAERIKSLKYPDMKITFLTAHSSKGLGFDNVILVNMIEAKFGFPSQIDDDPIMKLVTYEDNTVPYAEERRLFYVAMTRTRNRVYMIAPRQRPSRFVIELIRDFKVPYDKRLNLELTERHTLKCPACGFPLKYENNKIYGIPLYMCTNEPEICDFMTNDRVAPHDIYKCPRCPDGYMIVKKNKANEERFYGCTNFERTGKGCAHTRPLKGTT